MYVFSAPTWDPKSNLYVRNGAWLEPVLNLYMGGFKMDNTCWFKILVERVCKDILLAFPNGLYKHKLKHNEVDLLSYQV